MGDRKNGGVHVADPAIAQTGRQDYVPLTRRSSSTGWLRRTTACAGCC